MAPGESFELSGEFEVGDSPTAALDVTLAPRVPDGWSVDGEPVQAARLRSGQALEGSWTITAGADAEPGSADVSLAASFRATADGPDDPLRETERSVGVEVVPEGWLVVREAESDENTRSGTARTSNCSPCSGGVKIGSIGRGPDNYVDFNAITVDAAGEYTMIIDYLVDGTRSFFISVNGGEAVEVPVSGTSFNSVFSTEVTVRLEAGSNTIRFGNPGPNDPGPDLDRIVIAEPA